MQVINYQSPLMSYCNQIPARQLLLNDNSSSSPDLSTVETEQDEQTTSYSHKVTQQAQGHTLTTIGVNNNSLTDSLSLRFTVKKVNKTMSCKSRPLVPARRGRGRWSVSSRQSQLHQQRSVYFLSDSLTMLYELGFIEKVTLYLHSSRAYLSHNCCYEEHQVPKANASQHQSRLL